jgi:hypothetical protein
MTDRNIDQLLDAWMDLGPATAPMRVAEAVRLEVRSTRQTATLRGWPLRRFPFMNTTVRYSLAAAVVAVAAVLGYAYLAGPNIGGPVQPSQPASTERPGASIGADLPVLSDQSGPLEPGTYVVTEVEPLRMAITVPDGWTRNVAPATVWTQNSRVHIWFGRVDNLYADPCDDPPGDPMVPPLGPTAQDLADALASYEGIDAAVSDVTVSGFAGHYVELSVAEPTGDWCGGESRLWDIEEGQQLGLPGIFGTLGVWTFDVSGDRLVIAGDVRAAAESADAEGLDTIMDSLEIQAP